MLARHASAATRPTGQPVQERRMSAVRRCPGVLACALAATWLAAIPVIAQTARQPAGTVTYALPQNPNHQPLHDRLKAERWLERMQTVFQAFRLPRPVALKIESCGEVDASFSRGTVGLCYEYLQVVMRRIEAGQLAAWVTPGEALAGAFVDVVLHEFAHALVEQLRLPVLGREEEAADQLSAYMMLQFGGDDVAGLIRGTAHMYLSWIGFFQSRTLVPLGSGASPREARAHPTAGQRLYNLVCLALGSDDNTYVALAKAVDLPPERAKDCAGEFAQIERAWRALVRPHVNQALETETRRELRFFTNMK
jgi:hypothetical protein